MITRRAFSALPLSAALAAAPAPANPPRLRRADSFFGLHFDLHPSGNDTVLGRDVTEAMVEKLVTAARPDYLQYDSKGHAGWLGWPSKVGPSSPGIINDSLAIYRKVTARHGVALYIHFSGVWDTQAITRHPGWARLDAKGKPDGRNTSTFSPYVDELMIPQLREAATLYDLDGAWVDGECWSVQPDFSPAAIAAFKQASGRSDVPQGPNDAHWLDFLEFNRRRFRDYVKHYVDALHQSHPKFQIASNWLYSTMVPDQPSLPVDFLSGDYLGNAAISRARVEARFLAQSDRPWDLMAWGFQQADSNSVGHIHKPATQLMQEATTVLTQGGGFQIYYQPSRAGHFEDSHIQVMAKVGRFCRERQAVCHKSEAVPQIGVVFSRESLYRTSNRLFGGWGRASDQVRGWLDAVLDNQYSADILPDWKLASLASAYPLIVLPEWAAPGEAALNTLARYAESGGVLIAAGVENCRWLAPKLGFTAAGEAKDQPAFIGGGEVLANARGIWQDVEPGAAQVLATRHPDRDSTRAGKPAILAARLGKGQVVVIPGPLGLVYAATHAPAIRDLVRRLIQPRFKPMVEISAPPVIEVALRRKSGVLYVHLSNLAQMQTAGDFAALDYVPEAGPIRLNFAGRQPSALRLEPGGKIIKPPFVLDRIHLHTALAVVY
jgi:hypothetical protein